MATTQPQSSIAPPPAFPLSAVECITLAEALETASTSLRQFAEKRALGQGLEDPEAGALWMRFALAMVSVQTQGKGYSQRMLLYAREVRRWGGLDG